MSATATVEPGIQKQAVATRTAVWALASASDQRWNRPYTDLVYQPMLEVMQYLRANGYKTYIVTGGGQDFVRVYGEQVYGIPPEQVIGSALETQYTYNKQGQGILVRPPKLLLNDDFSGKPEDICLFIGRHPKAAFGNSTGDQQMLEYTQADGGATLMMTVLHDDTWREYAYGPAMGLPDTKVGTFTQALYDEASQRAGLSSVSRTTGSRFLRGKGDHYFNQKEKSIAMKTAKKAAVEVLISGNGAGYATEEVIRKRAYDLYEHRGCADGLDVEDWLAAEAELQQSPPV